MPGRDLFISAFAPSLGSGRATRMYTLVRALAQLGPLDLAYVPFGRDQPDPAYRAVENLAFHPIRPSRGLRRGLAYASRRAAGYQDGVARGASPEILAAARELAGAPGRGRVIGGDMIAMCALMPLARRRPIVFNTHNIESAPEHDPKAGRRAWLPMAVIERRIMRRACETWVVSVDDLKLARALAPGAALRLAPNAVDAARIVPRDAPGGGDVVLMVADYTYDPNLRALELLVGEIMPRVWAGRPSARLRLVGRGLPPERLTDPRIEALGFAESLTAAYATADAVAVPLVVGGGTSVKFVEAMAYGVPLVSTPVGARGLGLTPGEHYREAADPGAFAGALLDVLATGDAELATRARAEVQRRFSVEALAGLLDPAVPPAVS